jgi:NAD(P)-dependent dehydrogenase (short-subunit alcohol dehydrogenase family)
VGSDERSGRLLPVAVAADGAIINIASLSAHRGRMLAARYTASKHGVLAFTKAFATEWVS